MIQKKVLIIVIVLAVICCGLSIWLGVSSKNKAVAKYEQEQAKLMATINAYGPEVTVYTVKTTVMPGEEITKDNTAPMTSNKSSVTGQMVQNIDDIIGKEFKIALTNGTPITHNMVMEEPVRADTRDRDIIVDSWPVGLKVGDYIDISLTMPYGDDFTVVSHKRVYEVNDNTLKLYLDAVDWNNYIGAYVDYSLNAKYGATIYVSKYVEPGLQAEAVPYYAVPSNIAALLQKNPNIVDKEGVASTNEWRSSIEELLTMFRDAEDTVDTDGSTLAESRAKYNESVKSDMNTQRENAQETAETTEEEDFVWEDPVAEPQGAPAAVDDALSTAEEKVGASN